MEVLYISKWLEGKKNRDERDNISSFFNWTKKKIKKKRKQLNSSENNKKKAMKYLNTITIQ